MNKEIAIGRHNVGTGNRAYIVAEMSANHNKDFETAKKIIFEARKAGADAIKLQTYTPDTITIDCRNKYFKIRGSKWDGQNLYDLYKEAYTPWDWQGKLKEIAESIGLEFFSTPFDPSAVDFLQRLNVSVYKVASFELVDHILLRKIALTGKPIILSTGMATKEEIADAVNLIKELGNQNLILLKCTSAYPSPPEEINLRTMQDMSESFNVPVGLSDHTLGGAIAVAAVSLGACVIEKHLTLSRTSKGPDNNFSMEPDGFRRMVNNIRNVEKALGKPEYNITESQVALRDLRRSLFVVKDIQGGERLSKDNIRSIRPGFGLHTKHYEEVMKMKAKNEIRKGTPLSWDMIE